MAKREIEVEMNLEKIILETREVAKALNDFADRLVDIEIKYNRDRWKSEQGEK